MNGSAIVRNVVRRLPAHWIRCLGRLQFAVPLIAPVIRKCGRLIASGEGVIENGIGRGLRFNGTDGFPGYMMGTSEPLEQATLAKLLKPGSAFYDIGANIGFYSTIGARIVGASGKVFAFEPFPIAARRCRANAELNGYSHVSVIEAAIGGKEGVAMLELGDNTALHRLSELAGSVPVPIITIDAWLARSGAPPPQVVMIDIEGNELDALRGMKDTLARYRPSLMIEVHWLGERFASFYEDELLPLGYTLSTYDGSPVPSSPERYHALLTVSE